METVSAGSEAGEVCVGVALGASYEAGDGLTGLMAAMLMVIPLPLLSGD